MPLVRLSEDSRRHLLALTGLEPEGALDYFDRFYGAPLAARLDLTTARVLDCACGNGWLAAVLALRGAREVVAVDLDEGAVARTRALVDVLALGSRVTAMVADVTRLPFESRSFDAVCSIETLEHVPMPAALVELVRVCDRFFEFETINQHFPIDTHDTGLPFIHWLPPPLRAALHARLGYVSPPSRFPTLREIEAQLADFALVTPFKTFNTVEEWEHVFPFFHPYQRGRRIDLSDTKWRAKRAYFRAVFRAGGRRSRFALDKLMGIYERTDGSARAEAAERRERAEGPERRERAEAREPREHAEARERR